MTERTGDKDKRVVINQPDSGLISISMEQALDQGGPKPGEQVEIRISPEVWAKVEQRLKRNHGHWNPPTTNEIA